MQTVIQRRSLSNIIQLTLILLLCLLLICACSRRPRTKKTTYIESPTYIYVETSILTDKLPNANREITETYKFKSIAHKVTKVALKAPDYCSGQAASMSDRQVKSTKSFIRSECGVEMGALERKLTEEGYTVYSWKAVDSIMNSQNKSMLLAAQELGAEVLFTVNALEGIFASSDDMIKRSFFWSDKDGIKGAPAELVEEDRQEIRQVAKPYDDKLRGISLGAFLDVTAIEVATGQAIWFYKSGKYDIKRVGIPMTLAVTKAFDNWYWKVYMVDGVAPVRQNTLASSEIGSIGATPQFQISDNYYDKYVRDVVADFVDTLKASRKSSIGVNR